MTGPGTVELRSGEGIGVCEVIEHSRGCEDLVQPKQVHRARPPSVSSRFQSPVGTSSSGVTEVATGYLGQQRAPSCDRAGVLPLLTVNWSQAVGAARNRTDRRNLGAATGGLRL